MRFTKTAALSALIVFMLSACTSLTAGHPIASDISKDYNGPALSTDNIRSTSVLTPGSDISIGAGKNKVTCTAGWLVKDKGSLGLLTAGHCVLGGEGAPVKFSYRDGGTTRDVLLGEVAFTSFKEPYDVANPDVAIVVLEDNSENHEAAFLPIPDEHNPPVKALIGESDVGEAKQLASQDPGGEICWYAGKTSELATPNTTHCGAIIAADNGNVYVKPNSAEDYAPYMAGAPAVWNAPSGQSLIAGIVTNYINDRVVINTIGAQIEKSGAEIYYG